MKTTQNYRAFHFSWTLAALIILLMILAGISSPADAASRTDTYGNKLTISHAGSDFVAGKAVTVKVSGVDQNLYTEDPSQIPGPDQLADGSTLFLPEQISWSDSYNAGGSLPITEEAPKPEVTVNHVGVCKFTALLDKYQLQTAEDGSRAWIPDGTASLERTVTMKGAVHYDAGKGKFKNGKKIKTRYHANGVKLKDQPTPTLKKKYFAGWYTKKKGGKLISKTYKVKFGRKKEITYYAHWSAKTPIIDYHGRNASRIPVLTYHRLATYAEKRRYGSQYSSLLVVDSSFKRQMKWLHDHKYYTLSMDEFYLWHQGKIKVPPKSVLITFDDGMYSIIKYGLPVLKQYKMKGTMFMIGANIPSKTNKKPNPNGSYHTTGRDVMAQVTRTYPDFEFQSHTWGMHVRAAGGNGYARTKSYAYQKADFLKMYKKFGYRYLAYPFGHYTSNTIKAAKAGHIKMAFTYGANGYATRGQSKYTIRRIKIDGNESFSRFTRWF